MRLSSFFLPTDYLVRHELSYAVQIFHLSDGSEIASRHVSMNQPRNVMSSLRPPSAFIFLIDAGSGRFIGSSRWAREYKMRNRAMKTACAAHNPFSSCCLSQGLRRPCCRCTHESLLAVEVEFDICFFWCCFEQDFVVEAFWWWEDVWI